MGSKGGEGDGKGVVVVRSKTDGAQDKKGDGRAWRQLMPESARTCWKVPNALHSSNKFTKYSTLSRHVWIHIEPSLCRHRDPSSCLFKHLRIWKGGRNISAHDMCVPQKCDYRCERG
jgi:hypothetical protein